MAVLATAMVRAGKNRLQERLMQERMPITRMALVLVEM